MNSSSSTDGKSLRILKDICLILAFSSPPPRSAASALLPRELWNFWAAFRAAGACPPAYDDLGRRLIYLLSNNFCEASRLLAIGASKALMLEPNYLYWSRALGTSFWLYGLCCFIA
jgi:hypothetical protein